MRNYYKALGIAGTVGISFLAGYWFHPPVAAGSSSNIVTRKPLYYHDPMHPAYKSDKPGTAPDCGMQLEPVFEEKESSRSAPGTVQLTARKEKLLGLQTARVSSGSNDRSIRTTGRVTADETTITRISALADGVVRSVSPLSPGSPVRKDELLATYFVSSRDLFNAMQAFFLSSGTLDQNATTLRNPQILKTGKAESRVEEELLKSYGVSSSQIRTMMQTREITRDIEFRAPLAGIVLDRNVNEGSVITKGAELFRIADLSRIWIIADVFEADADAFRPGAMATILYGDHTTRAAVSNVRQFDAASRTLKVRLQTQNPGLQLRPDMPVSVVLDVRQPSGLSVPADSVVDEGRRQVVFVALADDKFEPRTVTTGGEHDGRVAITSGLRPSETIVTSGTFLLDAESRLERGDEHRDSAPAGQNTNRVVASDPVCGMPLTSTSGQSSLYSGTHYHFCSKTCKEKFDANPAGYSATSAMKNGLSGARHNS